MVASIMTTKASHLLTQTARRKYPLFILLAIILVIIYPFTSSYLLPGSSRAVTSPAPITASEPLSAQLLSQFSGSSSSSSTSGSAKDLPARTLLARPISKDRTTIPKIIHQTWFPAGSNMSESAKGWVETVKRFHPDWEYVLWDDESNDALVREHFPWFWETYRELPKEINRADMARNFYMYLFGGMYADVDTEALRPVDTLFFSHDVALNTHQAILSSPAPASAGNTQRAFMGRMAHTLDPEGLGAIPNGWMASPPGHPFWLLSVLSVLENPKGDGSVEGMTGPGILGPLIKQYFGNTPSQRAGLRRQLCMRIQSAQPGWDLFCPMGSLEEDGVEELQHSLVLLPREQIYPFSWADDGEVKVCLGAKSNPLFDPEACKRRMDVDAWPSYFITYCTHTW
ncbi:nucleotide-diphospho-sugar transferase [Aspergillus crustosus]